MENLSTFYDHKLCTDPPNWDSVNQLLAMLIFQFLPAKLEKGMPALSLHLTFRLTMQLFSVLVYDLTWVFCFAD